MTAGRRFLSDRLDWNLLRTCLVITQESSISRAAARLQVTQLAVSRVLKRLEEQLQCTLILRQGTRFALTEAGEEILHIASNIYGNVSRLSAALESRNKDMAGKVRILCATGGEAAGYVACLACVHQQYPRVELGGAVMRSADIISSLLQQTATLGLCRLLPATGIADLDRYLRGSGSRSRVGQKACLWMDCRTGSQGRKQTAIAQCQPAAGGKDCQPPASLVSIDVKQ